MPPVVPPGPPPLPAREATCFDNLDNDLDGLLDCSDPDCAADLTCASAPPLDRTIAPGFHDSVRFLYEGPHAVQLGADPAVFDAMRVRVLRGRVLDRDGAPVEGVRVSVHGNDAYGYTETRDGGVFDLVVNGGVPLTVSYEAVGFLPVQRTIDTGERRFRQYHWVPDVVLTQRDPIVTEIVPEAAAHRDRARGRRTEGSPCLLGGAPRPCHAAEAEKRPGTALRRRRRATAAVLAVVSSPRGVTIV